MRLRPLTLFALSLAMSAGAHANGQEVPAAPQQTQAKPEDTIVVKGEKDPKKKVVCRGAVATGSIVRKQTCMTQVAWQEREEKDRATMGSLQEQQARRAAMPQQICMMNDKRC